ncbi:glycylpeptide N-tetradecanoyltransferase 2-like [Acanthaster planci]|uniref:Glycylpeptide N-tetradecanoyltransferase n=1 Tax=Acanthaster planci TaxID=133434 RepID=A0A8B7XID6_ACAPL|nr:glycylpeptide N-tetradecanoyltransferase 2-like [Acanthaster planci]
MADDESEIFDYLKKSSGPQEREVDGKKGGDAAHKKDLSNHAIKANSTSVAATTNGDENDGASTSGSKATPQTNATSGANAQLSMAKLRDFQRAMEMFVHQGPAKNIEDAKKKVYNFWDTQPVPKIGESIASEVNEPVEPDKADIRSEPFSLPAQFVWDTLDIHDSDTLQELYTLLNENYVEDDDNMFRFDYSADFLIWALTPPGWLQEWHCGVRVASNNKLVGFISGVPANICIYEKQQRMVEINFLCVHKKLRSKRVAPVLIREITRRVHQQGLFQAVYTAGVVLPKPVATCRYWHRSLNPKKLIDVKFSHIGRNMTLQRTIKLYKLPDKPKLDMRPLEPTDIPTCCKLFRSYMMKFSLAPVFNEDEFTHWFTPREGIISTYVLETDGEVTDFISYYTLPSSIMHHPVHKKLKAAYAFYSVSTKHDIVDLMHTALTLAKQDGFDVFNALDLMENKAFLEKLKFGIGDGNLQYYLYNWRCKGMEPHQIGLVLQ